MQVLHKWHLTLKMTGLKTLSIHSLQTETPGSLNRGLHVKLVCARCRSAPVPCRSSECKVFGWLMIAMVRCSTHVNFCTKVDQNWKEYTLQQYQFQTSLHRFIPNFSGPSFQGMCTGPKVMTINNKDYYIHAERGGGDTKKQKTKKKNTDETMKRSLKLVLLQCVLFFQSPNHLKYSLYTLLKPKSEMSYLFSRLFFFVSVFLSSITASFHKTLTRFLCSLSEVCRLRVHDVTARVSRGLSRGQAFLWSRARALCNPVHLHFSAFAGTKWSGRRLFNPTFRLHCGVTACGGGRKLDRSGSIIGSCWTWRQPVDYALHARQGDRSAVDATRVGGYALQLSWTRAVVLVSLLWSGRKSTIIFFAAEAGPRWVYSSRKALSLCWCRRPSVGVAWRRPAAPAGWAVCRGATLSSKPSKKRMCSRSREDGFSPTSSFIGFATRAIWRRVESFWPPRSVWM